VERHGGVKVVAGAKVGRKNKIKNGQQTARRQAATVWDQPGCGGGCCRSAFAAGAGPRHLRDSFRRQGAGKIAYALGSIA
jgi:hypothetical protein